MEAAPAIAASLLPKPAARIPTVRSSPCRRSDTAVSEACKEEKLPTTEAYHNPPEALSRNPNLYPEPVDPCTMAEIRAKAMEDNYNKLETQIIHLSGMTAQQNADAQARYEEQLRIIEAERLPAEERRRETDVRLENLNANTTQRLEALEKMMQNIARYVDSNLSSRDRSPRMFASPPSVQQQQEIPISPPIAPICDKIDSNFGKSMSGEAFRSGIDRQSPTFTDFRGGDQISREAQ